ncbi:putative HlyD family efflux transporter periplasmic adaptor subunit [Azospirillaceae bacterium]
MTKKSNVSSKVKTPPPTPVRHPLKAAALLQSASRFVLRGPIYGAMISASFMLVYSSIATIDELVSVPLTLQRRSTTIQSISTGRIYQIRVNENDHVNRGDPIVIIQETIRATMTPEQEQMTKEKSQMEERLSKSESDYGFRKQQLETQLSDLNKRQGSDKGHLITSLGQLKDSLGSVEAKLGKVTNDLANAQSSLSRLQPLCARHDIPATQCEQAQQLINAMAFNQKTTQNEISSLKRSIEQTEKDIKDLSDKSTISRLENEMKQAKSDHERELNLLKTQILDIENRILKSTRGIQGVHPMDDKENKDKLVYAAPFDGVITSIPVKRDEIITAMSPVAVIVDDEAPLEGRVLIQNKDIGNVNAVFLKEKPEVKIKYAAYPFQDYGIQSGRMNSISTLPSANPKENGAYVGSIALDSETITRLKSHDTQILTIGLIGIAEVKVRDKRFIEALFK